MIRFILAALVINPYPSTAFRYYARGFKSPSAPLLLCATIFAATTVHRTKSLSIPLNMSSDASIDGAGSPSMIVDSEYPGTAVERMLSARARVKSLSTEQLSGDWEDVRRLILWAGGLKDLPNARPGQGYTGHSFNDYNHCDLTTMLDEVSANTNGGQVRGIAFGNQLGPGIKIATLPELGPGGSWSTCMMGCNEEPPQDVAHLQFKSRIAFKLVWSPPEFTSFVLVDDAGTLLNQGTPTGILPEKRERIQNYRLVQGSKYAVTAENMLTSR